MIRLVYILSIVFCIACNSDKRKESFSREDFNKTANLVGKTIKFDAPLNPLNYTIISDSLIVVTNWDGNPYLPGSAYINLRPILITPPVILKISLKILKSIIQAEARIL